MPKLSKKNVTLTLLKQNWCLYTWLKKELHLHRTWLLVETLLKCEIIQIITNSPYKSIDYLQTEETGYYLLQ